MDTSSKQVERMNTVYEQWKEYNSKQEALVKRIMEENNQLMKELDDLQLQNYSLKKTLIAIKRENEENKSLTEELEQRVAQGKHSVKAEIENDLVLTLIDGDGYLFHPQLLASGEQGGREAARLINAALNDYLAAQRDYKSVSGMTPWTMIFYSKEQMETSILRSGICSSDQFMSFLKGFQQAYPMFSLVEVGQKEAVIYKVREHITQSTGKSGIYKVFVGVDHHDGYGLVLTGEIKKGFKDKLVLLRGHSAIARRIETMGLSEVNIETAFQNYDAVVKPLLTGQITSYAAAAVKSPNMGSMPIPQAVDGRVSPTGFSQTRSNGKPMPHPVKRNPPPCNHFYLMKSCTAAGCTYGHDYILSEEEFKQLAIRAKQQPCKYVNENQQCWFSNCMYGHKCPNGPTCFYLASKRCKFVGDIMHDP